MLRKCMKRITDKQKKLIILLVVVMTAGAMLIYAISSVIKQNGGLPINGLIRAETLYVIAIFLAIIPNVWYII